MIKYGRYARYSSENQNETSIEGQLFFMENLAKLNDYELYDTYIDRAYSGTTENRPDFQRLLSDMRDRKFDVLMVHKLDRIARDDFVMAKVKEIANASDIKIVSVVERCDDTPEGKLMMNIISGFASFYSLNLSRETKKGFRGMLEEMKVTGKAKFMGGKIPFGYDLNNNNEFVINEREATTVNYIYDLFINGNGYQNICRILDKKGLYNKKGEPFKVDNVRLILKYEPYTGVFIHKTNPTNKFYDKYRKEIKHQLVEERIEGIMPVIVEREKYLKVKSIMDNPNRYKNKRDAKELYLLSGIIKCGRCGSIMIGNRNGTLAYYICPTKKKTRTCDTHNIPKKVVEEIVLSYLEEQFSDNAINNMIRYLEENKINYVSAYNEKIKRLVAEKSAITKKIDNLVNMGLNGSLQDIFNTKLKELKEKYEAAELQIAEIKTVLAKEDDLSNKINGYIKSVSNIRGYDLNRQARIIRSLVRKVEIICNGKGKKDFTVMIESVFGKEEFTENGQKQKPTSDEECGLSLVAPRRIELRIQP